MRHTSRGTAVGVAIAALLPCSAAAQQWSSAQQEVWAAVEALWDASERSADAWNATMSDDYRGWSVTDAAPTTKAQGAPFRAHFAASIRPIARSLIPLAIDIHGDVAVVFYGYQMITETEASGESFERGRWTDVYRNQNGRWLLIADYGGPTS